MKIIKISLIIVLIVTARTAISNAPVPSFDQIATCAQTLPTFRHLCKTAQKTFPGRDFLFNCDQYKQLRCVSLEMFEEALNAFFTLMKTELSSESLWFESADHVKQMFHEDKEAFRPYALKKIIMPAHEFICKGDLHGDMHSLIAFIKHLQSMNITSKDNALKIIKPDFTLIFHGDYVDRSLWGVEVLYLLIMLKLYNPQQVILIRGNHEDLDINQRFGFTKEFFAKFSDHAFRDCQRVYNKIARFYELLPVVLYLGCCNDFGCCNDLCKEISGNTTSDNNKERFEKQKSTKKIMCESDAIHNDCSKEHCLNNDCMNVTYDFIQCCHGGLEFGHNPKDFLACDKACYQLIKSLNRYTAACAMPEQTVMHHGKEIPLADYCEDFEPKSPTNPYPLGFMWHDFVVHPHGKNNCHGHRLQCNRSLTHATLEAASTKSHRLCAIIRAHQHTTSNQDPLMRLLLTNNGCAVLWHEIEGQIKLSFGTVITLLLSPDNLIGTPGIKRDWDGFDYDTYLKIKTARKLEDWQVTVVNNHIYKENSALPETDS